LKELSEDDCVLTGVCWDIDIIQALKKGNLSSAMKSLHSDTEYLYSDEGLKELCEANEYHFTAEGKHLEP